MEYLIHIQTESTNKKLKYIIKSTLQRIAKLRVKVYEMDDKFVNENQLSLFK